MDEKRIVAYSLLAHINNKMNAKGINDLSDIFAPLVKNAIASLYQNGITQGQIDDLKKQVDATYSFDMPYSLLIKIVKRIAYEANKDQDNAFFFYNDHSFMIKKFIFSEYEDFISRQKSEIGILNRIYTNYLETRSIDPKSQPSIFEFLDRNRASLSQFFANRVAPYIDSSYLPQADFVNSIKENQDLYNILKRIYLGSIISNYLELDYGDIKGHDLEFLLDTNFLISILDLHSKEATHTCLKIIEISKKFGYKLKTLNFTVEETKALLNRIASSIHGIKIFEQLDTNSIENACHRRNLNKTDLEKAASGLETILRKDFQIHIITDKNYLKEKAETSELFEKLKNRKINPAGALHDAMAIMYVQERRGKEIVKFDEACCWFVTDSKNEYIKFIKKDGKYSEVIRAEDLVNVLWLTNPSANFEEIADMGLTHLVSITINNSLPNLAVLKELDENIQKYAVDKIAPEDCVKLANNIASQTVVNLENISELNKVAKESPENFVRRLKEYSKQVEIEQKERQEATNAMMQKLKSDFESQLKSMESDLKGTLEKEIGKSKKAILERDKKLSEVKKANLLRLENDFSKLKEIKDSLDEGALRKANMMLRNIVELYILEILILVNFIIRFGWSKMAPIVYVLSAISTLGGYLYVFVTKRESNLLSIYKHSIELNKINNYNKSKFDIEYFNSLKEDIDKLKLEIQEEK